MATERIDDIISSEAINGIIELNNRLKDCMATMDSLVAKAAELNRTMQNGTMRDVAQGMQQLNDISEKVNQTESQRLNIEREIKAEGQKMKQVLESEAQLWKKVDEALEKTTLDMTDLIQSMITHEAQLNRNKDAQKKLKKELEETKAEYKAGAISLQEYDSRTDKARERLEYLIGRQSELKKTLSEENIMLKNHASGVTSAQGSYDEMNARLGRLRDTYRKLSEEERNNAEIGGVIMQGINQLDEELKALDKTMGNNQRNVGNYEISAKTIRSELMASRNELMELNLTMDAYNQKIEQQRAKVEQARQANGEQSNEYNTENQKLQQLIASQGQAAQSIETLKEKVSSLTAEQKRTNAEMDLMSQKGVGMKALVSGVNDVTQAFAAYKSIMVVAGVDTENAQKAIAKLSAIQSVATSIQRISNSLLSKNGTLVKARVALTKLQITYRKNLNALEVKAAAATTAQGAAATGAAAANKGLSVAIRSVGAAIKSVPVIGWILALVTAVTSAVAVFRKFQDSADTKRLDALNSSLQYTKNLMDAIGKNTDFKAALAAAQGESQELIQTLREKGADEELAIAQQQTQKALKAWQGARRRNKEEFKQAYLEAKELEKEVSEKRNDIYNQGLIAEVQSRTDAENKRNEQAKQAHEKRLEEQRRFNEDRLKLEKDLNRQLEDMQADSDDKKHLLALKRMEQERNELLQKYKNYPQMLEQINNLYNEKMENENADYLKRVKEANEKSLADAINAAKTAIDDAWAKLDTEQKDKVNKMILSNGGKLGDDATQQAYINELQARISKMDELKNKYLEAGMTEEEYAMKHRELEAELTLATEQSVDERIAKIKQEKEMRTEAASAMVGSLVTLGNAMAENIEDEKTKVTIQQSLALAQVLLEQGKAIAAAITLSLEGGDPYTVAFRIAAAVASVTASFISATTAIRQAGQAVSQASAYAEGTEWHRGGDAVVGEGGSPEYVIAGQRKFIVNEPTLIRDLPVGSKVIPLTEKTMNGTTDLSEVVNGINRLNSKKTVNVNVGKDVYAYIVAGASRTRIINKQFSH